MMRRFSANYIFPANKSALKNGIVEVNDSGEILNIIDTKGELQESRNLEFYNGIITPGFVNTHCHLELSEHKSKIEKGVGLHNFIESIFELKKLRRSEHTFDSIKFYDDFMKRKGIVAVGDICNTDKTIRVKKKSTIYYHNFIEALGFGDAKNIMESNQKLYLAFLSNDLSCSIVPHAPYSVSQKLFKLISEQAEKNKTVLSIHNQETSSENEMFKTKSGKLYDKLKSLGIDFSDWKPSGKNSSESIVDDLPKSNHILFVHNTYSSEADVKLINKTFKNAFWCLCPSSNLYIENKLPKFDIFRDFKSRITLGTDSLVSNTTLSILEEMKIISSNYPTIDFADLLKWGTINGAKALKIDEKFGSIEKGKTPGLNLISNFNFERMQLTEKSDVKVLV